MYSKIHGNYRQREKNSKKEPNKNGTDQKPVTEMENAFDELISRPDKT